jgi:hypothetical protein
MQDAKRMSPTVICGLAGCTMFSPASSPTARSWEAGGEVNNKCVLQFPLQLLSETFLILRRTERDMVKNVR